MRSKGGTLPGAAIVEKARELAAQLEIKDFTGSAGWLAKFKIRHMIQEKTYRRRYSTADSVGAQFVEETLPAFFTEQVRRLSDSTKAPGANLSQFTKYLLSQLLCRCVT